jgi:hypothetical protein
VTSCFTPLRLDRRLTPREPSSLPETRSPASRKGIPFPKPPAPVSGREFPSEFPANQIRQGNSLPETRPSDFPDGIPFPNRFLSFAGRNRLRARSFFVEPSNARNGRPMTGYPPAITLGTEAPQRKRCSHAHSIRFLR